jgi:mannose-6-phosphate isomerase-like protein (cupin superfamily)
VILGPGEGHAHYRARGSEMFFKAVAKLDGGDLSLMERTLPPGGRRPPPHRHTNCSEAYFVLDGVVSIIVDGEELTVGREGFVLVPRGTAHTFGNTSAEPARLLVIHAPAMDAYFAGLHELWNRPEPPSPDEERALMSRFGMDPALDRRPAAHRHRRALSPTPATSPRPVTYASDIAAPCHLRQRHRPLVSMA